MNAIPVIRFEVEGIRHTLLVALSEHQAQMDADLQAAVDDFCKPENLRVKIHEIAKNALDVALHNEIESFFKFGDGRRVIVEAIKSKLLKDGSVPEA